MTEGTEPVGAGGDIQAQRIGQLEARLTDVSDRLAWVEAVNETADEMICSRIRELRELVEILVEHIHKEEDE